MLRAAAAPPPAGCRKLRSVEAAAHLLQSFKRIQTQGAIQRQMSDKLADVLAHFYKEVRGLAVVGGTARAQCCAGREGEGMARCE